MKKVVYSIALLLLMGLVVGCNGKKADNQINSAKANKTSNTNNTSKDKDKVEDLGIKLGESNTIGEGKNTFLLKVVDDKGTSTDINISTNKQKVGEALLELGIIEGEEGQYGLYVHTVCGMTYKYDAGGKYWAFYINDKYATTGVDKTDIKQGDIYTLKVQAN